jgi:hypothetical protein
VTPATLKTSRWASEGAAQLLTGTLCNVTYWPSDTLCLFLLPHPNSGYPHPQFPTVVSTGLTRPSAMSGSCWLLCDACFDCHTICLPPEVETLPGDPKTTQTTHCSLISAQMVYVGQKLAAQGKTHHVLFVPPTNLGQCFKFCSPNNDWLPSHKYIWMCVQHN